MVMANSLFRRNHWFTAVLCAGSMIGSLMGIVFIGAHLIGEPTGRQTGIQTNAARLLKTGAWNTFGDNQAWKPIAKLFIRRENDGSTGGLLLKHSARDIIYLYDPASQTLHTVDIAKWKSATSPIANCEEQLPPSPKRLEIVSNDERKLVDASGRTIATAGTFTEKLTVSPDNKWVAVLSANGPKSVSLLPFLGGNQPLGQQYHQVISMDDFKWIGTAVPLPVAVKSDLLEPCWTADEKYVVYTDTFFTDVLVVPVT
jgi:hypothetical protein